MTNIDKLEFKIDYGTFYPKSAIEKELGELLYKKTLERNAEKILELGTGVGVSTLYFARALKQLSFKKVLNNNYHFLAKYFNFVRKKLSNQNIKRKIYTYDKEKQFQNLAKLNLKNNENLDKFTEFYLRDLSKLSKIPESTDTKQKDKNLKNKKSMNNFLISNNHLSKNAPYDIIFLDTKKSLYRELFEYSLFLLNKNGIIIIDDMLIDKTKGVRSSVKIAIIEFREYLQNLETKEIIKTDKYEIGDGLYIVKNIF